MARQGKTFKPTADQKVAVRALSMFGIAHDDIAAYIGITAKTLRKHFTDLLALGAENWKTRLKIHLIQRAFKNDSMGMFVAKTQLGWRETDKAEAPTVNNFEFVFRETAKGERIKVEREE